jgi:hypothetical protein
VVNQSNQMFRSGGCDWFEMNEAAKADTGGPYTNSTPVLLIFRHTRRHRRNERLLLNVKSNASGRSIVFGISTPAPALVKSRTTQSLTEEFPSKNLAPLSTRLRVILRRSCIWFYLCTSPKKEINNGLSS